MRVRVLNFKSGLKGNLLFETENNMSVVKDDEGKIWSVPKQDVLQIVPFAIGDVVKSILGFGDSRFTIVAIENSKDGIFYICRSMRSDSTWESKKRYAYTDNEIEHI